MKPIRGSLCILTGGLLLTAVALLVACSGSDKGSNGSSSAAAPTATTAAANSAGGGIDVSITSFAFTPATLSAPAGQPLTLNLKNDSTTSHTFTIDGVVDSGTLGPGQSKQISFTPSQDMVLTYYCKIHGAATMSGKLTIGAGGAAPTPVGGGTASSDSDYDYNY